MKEAVNHPAHYGGEENPFEPIKIIEYYGMDFHLGNVVKYVLRAGKKEDELADLKKAAWYLQRKIGLLQPGIEPENEIDWDEVQLVRSKTDRTFIVLTTGEHSGAYFSGVDTYVGYSNDKWDKASFEYHGEVAITEPENEIDWNRPQLVRHKIDVDYIVQTNGEHLDDEFYGSKLGFNVVRSDWNKNSFTYHGEIQ